MFGLRFMRLGTALILAALLSACGGEPPEKEMQQAQGAIDAARAAGAPEYAADEFGAAVKALERAQKAALERDYRQALNDALDARERAQTSARQAAENMASARVAADRAVAAATASLSALQKRLADLESSKTQAKLLGPPKQALSDASQRLQEARAAFEKGQYAAATSAATGATTALVALGRQLDDVTAPAVRRSR